MNEEQVLKRIIGLRQRYPNRKLIPFAKRDDCDDIACFELSDTTYVSVIHDYVSNGFEQIKSYTDFWEWLGAAIDICRDSD